MCPDFRLTPHIGLSVSLARTACKLELQVNPALNQERGSDFENAATSIDCVRSIKEVLHRQEDLPPMQPQEKVVQRNWPVQPQIHHIVPTQGIVVVGIFKLFSLKAPLHKEREEGGMGVAHP